MFDSVNRLLRGSARDPRPVTLEPGEAEQARVWASWNPGAFRATGGQLVLTDKRLIFTPFDLRDLAAVTAWGLTRAGVPQQAAGVIDELAEGLSGQHVLLGTNAIEAGTPPQLLKPPTVLVRATDGTVTEIGILASKLSPSISSANAVERDRFIDTVRAVLR